MAGQIAKDIRLQGDIQYSQRGSYGSEVESKVSDWNDLNSKNLDIGFQLAYTKLKHFAFEAGLSYSYLLDVKISGTTYWPRRMAYVGWDDRDLFSNETGASVGFNYSFYNFTFRVKYSFGLFGHRKFEINRWLLITAGYQIGL